MSELQDMKKELEMNEKILSILKVLEGGDEASQSKRKDLIKLGEIGVEYLRLEIAEKEKAAKKPEIEIDITYAVRLYLASKGEPQDMQWLMRKSAFSEVLKKYIEKILHADIEGDEEKRLIVGKFINMVDIVVEETAKALEGIRK